MKKFVHILEYLMDDSVMLCHLKHRHRSCKLFKNTNQPYIYIQGVPGGMCQTSGECSLGQTIPI